MLAEAPADNKIGIAWSDWTGLADWLNWVSSSQPSEPGVPIYLNINEMFFMNLFSSVSVFHVQCLASVRSIDPPEWRVM